VTGRAPAKPDEEQWRAVDEGWGRKAVDFATLSEPTNCREYVTVHHRLGVGAGDRLLDLACGSGLAVELAALRGARCAGIDASPRLVAIARDRSPEADLRVGDMNALPWEDESFDVVTSFRGIWGTTPDAVAEAFRVLVPGGRMGITVWGHIKVSPGAWAFAPFTLASEPKVRNQAAMVALGRPEAGETLLAQTGFAEVERIEVPFVFEFSDPETYARALASTGPAFEAIQAVGERSFLESAMESARQQVREGLPLRAPIALVGYLAVKPSRFGSHTRGRPSDGAAWASAGFLAAPPDSPESRRLLDDDLDGLGYVMNASRLWAHLPRAVRALGDLMGETATAGSLTFRQRAVLVTSAAAALGDAYCSLAWGQKLAEVASPDVAAAVITGVTEGAEGLEDDERALADWARRVARDPNATTEDDVERLRTVGFDERQIFAITTFVALRIAFATVNDALGAVPDRELSEAVPEQIRSAVSFGRRPPANGREG
jgi:SAM-dependent methyltransferase/alkylhydroperoxidase family enzyme